MIRRIVSDSSCDLIRFPGTDFVSVPLRILTAQKEYVRQRPVGRHRHGPGAKAV